MNWIKTLTELPKKGIWVLIYYENEHCCSGASPNMFVAKYDKAYSQDKDLCFVIAGNCDNCNRITSEDFNRLWWAELPKSPKELE